MKLFRMSGFRNQKSFLDDGTSLTGELSLSAPLRINGSLHGSIEANDLLIIGEEASIHADIKGVEVQIHGAVHGNVECSRKVLICPTGQLRGDIQTPRFVIEPGGVFEGRSRIPAESPSSEGAAERDLSSTSRPSAAESP